MTIKNKCENMDAKELRIGNLVTGGSRGKLVVVTAELIKGISDGVCVYNAIPLTEEWLLKFGFSKSKSSLYTILMGTTIFSISPPFKLGEWQCDYVWVYDEYRFTKLKYVHQLQNLYFCLSGEELKLN